MEGVVDGSVVRMDAPGGESESCGMTLHGDAIWNTIESFFDKHGASTMMSELKMVPSMSDYAVWLAGALEQAGDATWTTMPDGSEEAVGTCSLLAWPLDTSRARALRAVEFPELKDKAKAIILAQEWRDWDVLQVSRQPGTTGPEGTFVEDFHMRLCALGALFYVHWKQGLPLPPFLRAMGQSIPTKYLGHASRAVALARAVSNCASLQFGVTHLGWLDIVLQVVQVHGAAVEPVNGEDLQAQVLQLCPEYARKINSWQHMENLTTRVDPRCFTDAEARCAANGIPKSILPQNWFRETYFLQPAKKRVGKDTGLEALEQICATERMMTAVCEAWASSGESLSQNALGRAISSDDLKKYGVLAKKYVAGMKAQERETGIAALDTLADFASGAWDGFLTQARDETMSAYWPWVLEAVEKKRALADEEAVEDARQTAEKAAREEAQLRCEAEQLKAEECDAADQLRSRQEEHQQKLLTAAANLHAVNLRAHFTALKHFVHDKMPAAMALWQGKAARDAAENDARTKSLEQVVFVAVPESDGPVFSSNWVQHTSLQVVPFLDLARGVPQIAGVLPKVRSSGGVVMIVVAGNAAEVSARIALEAGVTKQLPEDAKLHRVFIRSSVDACHPCIKYVGWVLIALLPDCDAPYSPLQERVLTSQAVTHGCLLNLPGLMPDERVRSNSGHDLCPDQRPAKFHAALLQGFNIVSAFMKSGQSPMDFMLVQDETCTSSLAKCVVDMAGAHMAGQPSCGPQVHLVTQARKWDDEARPSLNFRLHHLSEARAALVPHFEKRALKRRKTDTSAQLEELAAGLPSAPPLPPKLAEALENVGASGFVRRPFLVASGKEVYDAGRAKLLRPDAPASTFENDAPPRLSLAVASTKANLLVAPSMLVRGASGLYSARAFAKGEVLCHGSSMCNAWVLAEEKPAEPTCTLQLALRHQFFQTKDVRAHLVGDPSRHLWTAMNSTEGLSGASRVEPNVEAVFGDGGAVEMNNFFLAFKAARDIGAFEELVWRYEWADHDAVGQTAVEAPAAIPPDAAP